MFETASPPAQDEQWRLTAVVNLGQVDQPTVEDFQRVVRLAAMLFDVPISMISLIGEPRRFLVARPGIMVDGLDRNSAFSASAIADGRVLVVPDAREDPRFAANPLVTGEPRVRFYAGAPLKLESGQAVGCLSIIDTKPRLSPSVSEVKALEDFAALAVRRMEIHRLERARQISQERLRHIASTTPDPIVCSDMDGRITLWNDAATRLFGHTAKQALGKGTQLIIPASLKEAHGQGAGGGSSKSRSRLTGTTVELTAQHRDGREIPIELSVSKWMEGGLVNFGAIIRDLTGRKDQERQLALSRLDALTGLPNRAAILDELRRRLERPRPLAVLLLDLDGFKDVNDTLGHLVGDRVLKEIGIRLRSLVPKKGALGRLGGDEFLIICERKPNSDVTGLSRSIIAAINRPINEGFETASVGTSIGIALYPEHAIVADDLLSAADLALYRAKADGQNECHVFEPALREQAIRRSVLNRELQTAVVERQFRIFYQPQVRLSDGKVIGAEALIRWQHPRQGILAPAAFLNALEKGPLAVRVGEWVLHEACQQASAWRRNLNRDVRISINLFGAQLNSNTLVETVNAVLQRSGLPPELLELEITENTILGEDRAALRSVPAFRTLEALHDLGVRIAFDDFGTGYASLSLLKSFPLSHLKIDRSFINNIEDDAQNRELVRTIVSLGKTFGYAVIGEGVETQKAHDFLLAEGCDEAQGYLYGRPMPADAFELFLEEWREAYLHG